MKNKEITKDLNDIRLMIRQLRNGIKLLTSKILEINKSLEIHNSKKPVFTGLIQKALSQKMLIACF